MNKTVEPFSSGYYLVDAQITEYSGEKVAVAGDLLDTMKDYSEMPLLKLGGSHYWASSEWGIPPDTVAVPDYVSNSVDENTVLMAKDDTVADLVLSREQDGRT